MVNTLRISPRWQSVYTYNVDPRRGPCPPPHGLACNHTGDLRSSRRYPIENIGNPKESNILSVSNPVRILADFPRRGISQRASIKSAYP